MDRHSQWYPLLAEWAFPTVFMPLRPQELSALDGSAACTPAVRQALQERLQRCMDSLPGFVVVGLDSCMPDDTEAFREDRSLLKAATALDLLASSPKVRAALAAGDHTVAVRPYRRMDRTREFRLFLKDGSFAGLSQRFLDRHYRRLDEMSRTYLQRAATFAELAAERLGPVNQVIDIYFTSESSLMIVDMNPWGDPTDPLLMRRWDRDWSSPAQLKLMPEPTRLDGDISVSF